MGNTTEKERRLPIQANLWRMIDEMWYGMGSPEVFFAYANCRMAEHKETLEEVVPRIYAVWIEAGRPAEICDDEYYEENEERQV